MTLTSLLIALLLTVVTLLAGGGVMAVLVRRPTLATPITAGLSTVMLMATVVGVLVAVTRS